MRSWPAAPLPNPAIALLSALCLQPAPDPRLDPAISAKRAKRILANRLAAAKSKLRKQAKLKVPHSPTLYSILLHTGLVWSGFPWPDLVCSSCAACTHWASCHEPRAPLPHLLYTLRLFPLTPTPALTSHMPHHHILTLPHQPRPSHQLPNTVPHPRLPFAGPAWACRTAREALVQTFSLSASPPALHPMLRPPRPLAGFDPSAHLLSSRPLSSPPPLQGLAAQVEGLEGQRAALQGQLAALRRGCTVAEEEQGQLKAQLAEVQVGVWCGGVGWGGQLTSHDGSFCGGRSRGATGPLQVLCPAASPAVGARRRPPSAGGFFYATHASCLTPYGFMRVLQTLKAPTPVFAYVNPVQASMDHQA